MFDIRKSHERGHARHGWLDSYHTFSFADYYDPAHLGFRTLRVINEDRVEPGRGFPTHPHRDMEILTYVLAGELRHEDSMGSGSVIRPGDVQRMSAGTGVTHSEYNDSATEPVHLLQIWILPDRDGLTPSYEQKTFSEQDKRGRLLSVASPDGRDGSVRIHQDATVYAAVLAAGESVRHVLPARRHVWLQVAAGRVALNGLPLATGDGVAGSDETALVIAGVGERAEVLLFDLA